METLVKRIKGAAWVSAAGFIVVVIGLVLENLDALELTGVQQTWMMIVGTAIVSQITKYLNTAKK
ncbi:MAG: hypothetical protein HOG49_41580 [Candidatus Scalindua sp.]|jgi:hypothetical protein|nr:hypothetical protein [Candidatus Scalindua sp.]